MEKKLPKGWVESTLGEIANWGSGGTPSRSRSEYYNGDIPWIKTGDLNNSVIMEASEFITELGLKNSSAKLFPKGSIGIAMYGATIGKTAFFGIDAATNQACAVAQPSSAIVDKFLHNYLKSQKQNFIDQGKGGAQPNISQTLIKAHPILLPPLPEQKRIVAKLDALFGHLDTLKTKLDHIPELLKNFRQQVLVEAFKLESNRVLLESVCEKIQDGAHHSPQEQFDEKGENQYLYITSKNIRNNYMNFAKVKYVSRDFHDSIYPRCNPEFGDVLLTKDGANTGQVTLNELHEPFSLLSSVCLKYYIQSPTGFQELIGQMTGTAIKRIILRKIKKAEIPLPSLDDQKEIVSRIDHLFETANRIESQYLSLKSKIDQLPQAILNKAFKGELVAQDPKDEPAAVLLERVKSATEKIEYKVKKKSIKLAAEEKADYKTN
jgi:type I restriction enzyme S subunit